MNNTLLLTRFNPAEILVFLKGYSASRREIITTSLMEFELSGQIRFHDTDDVEYVQMTNIQTNQPHELDYLLNSLKSEGNGTLLSHFVRILAETVDQHKLIRHILRKLKKAGYFSQNLLGWITGNFELTHEGREVQHTLKTEINQLRGIWQHAANKTQLHTLLQMLGARRWFITGEFTEGITRVDARWGPIAWAIEDEKRAAMILTSASSGCAGGCLSDGGGSGCGGDSGCSGCSGCGGCGS
ncbi:MAG: hypothetical protein IM638_14320 [Bacteroidetes bacterium]|nr:hypothetical protein [Bacteroidota bacterium]